MQLHRNFFWRLRRLPVILLALMCFPIALAVAQTPVTVRILSPPDGTTVEPGTALTVEVEALPIGQFAGVAAITPLVSDFKTSPPFVFTLQIPSDAPLGPQPLTAFIGLGKDDFVKSSITINVETATPVTSIQVTAPPLFIATEEGTSVFGIFADEVSREITRSREIAYSSSNPQVATVTSDGLIEPVENGEATITITYKNQSFSFPIKVDFKPLQRLAVIWTKLQVIVASNPGTPLADKVEDAVAKCQTALTELGKTPPDKQAGVGNIEGAVGDLQAAVDAGLLDFKQGTKLMDQLARTARQLAAEAIDKAIAQGGNPAEISDAQQALAEGDSLRASGAFKDAVNKYKDALAKAESALG